MKKLILIGAGGHAKVIREIALSSNEYDPYAFVDDSVEEFFGLEKILEHNLNPNEHKYLVIAFGAVTIPSIARRYDIFLNLRKCGFVFPTLVHSSAIVSESAMLRDGVTVGQNSVINAGAKVGEAVIINTSAIVEHDAEIGAASHVCPRAIVLGGAKVENHCLIGAGSVVLQSSAVPAGTLVKAASLYK